MSEDCLTAGNPRRILVVHNRYQQPGGEDMVFASEVALLRAGGCEVDTLEVSNDAIRGSGAKARAALGVIYNLAGRRLMTDAISRSRPDIVHVHNFFPRISPAVFDACAQAGVPVVWTLHNFRATCANGMLFRDGRPCEDCVGRSALPAVRHRCYRGSSLGSAAVAGMIGFHRLRATWHKKVTRFVALTDFARDLFVRAGLPAQKISVKSNFVRDPFTEFDLRPGAREGAIFVGRLSAEKGAAVLIDAWRSLPGITLDVIGDGPERAALEQVAPQNVRFLGFQPREAVLRSVLGARALIVPSIWYEPFGLVAAEAMALGTPVIASRIGALKSIVRDGIDGLHFAPGDAADLAGVTSRAFGDSSLLARLGRNARDTWQATMSPEINRSQLLAIYREAGAA